MGFWVVLLVVAVVGLWASLSRLHKRFDDLDADRSSSRALDAQFRELQVRVQKLEGALRPSSDAPTPAPPTETEPAPPPPALPPPIRPPAQPAVASVAPTKPSEPVARPRSAEPAARPKSPPPPAESPTAPSGTAAWEVTVGSNWLNKIGVLVFVIGMALLVSYSFTRVGPGGRIAIGYTIGLAMLGSGVLLERRRKYTAYAYGLVAGGWAGTYFTTYAMHGIEAARVIDSEVVGGALLALVAGAMIAHSIRYRSQTVTVLAFVVGYATLSIAPLSWFALFAALPLATTVLVVAHRYRWTPVAALGIAATYALFALRDSGVGGDALDGGSLAPYFMLAIYWLVFESADVLALRQTRTEPSQAHQSLFALNAVGLVGCTLLALPAGGVEFLTSYLLVMGAGYVVSAVLRRRLPSGGTPANDEPSGHVTTFHLAVGMATALVMWSSASRFDDSRLAMTWLVEAELLIALGFVLVDPVVRKIGGAAFLLTVGYGLLAAADATLLISSMAVTAYVNSEWLRVRGVMTAAPERGYAWLGAGLVSVVLAQEFSWTFKGLAFMAAAAVLLEAGLRRAAEYRYQAYTLGVLGIWFVLLIYGSWQPLPARDVWMVLPAATLLAWLGAVRSVRGQDDPNPDDPSLDERRAAAVAMAWLGAILLAVFEWHVVPDVWLGPAWAATGMALFGVGLARSLGALRWQGYGFMLVGGLPALAPILGRAPASAAEIVGLLITVAVLYAAGLLGSRSARLTSSPIEAWALRVLSSAAAAMLATLQWRVVPVTWSGPLIAATGAMHVGFGMVGRAALPRWQGYVLVMLGSLRALAPILGEASASPAQVTAALVGIGLLYAVAFAHARSVGARTLRTAAAEPETVVLGVLFVTATAMLATVEWRVLPLAWAGPAMALNGLLLFGAGAVTRALFLRAQGYALLALAVARASEPLFTPRGAPFPEILSLAGVIGCLYAGSYIGRRALLKEAWEAEPLAPRALLMSATVLLTWLVGIEMPPSLVTLAWGLMGLLLLVVGFPMRERLVRLAGLALLALCILKLFVYDLRELEALARIFSFVVLGLVLLGVSWAYTRFGDRIRKYL